ncbi:hypothetical protein B296_00029342 [Ensete ventricosum]|uniref:Secreted protein n=1 Tax=Ensete ventricosum TaxID=4639 RepID=A0A426Y2L3_ENSVE|nr:hypothetical protein B296_00029342 [Ensete ventricosum]
MGVCVCVWLRLVLLSCGSSDVVSLHAMLYGKSPRRKWPQECGAHDPIWFGTASSCDEERCRYGGCANLSEVTNSIMPRLASHIGTSG